MSVYIKKIHIKNFKSFKDEEIEFRVPSENSSGFNILVGENNSGKSSLIEAINFVFESTKKDLSVIRNKCAKPEDEVYVEMTFIGEITKLIESFCNDKKKDAFKEYVFVEGGNEQMIVKRDLSEKSKIMFFNKDKQEYANPSGIDASFKGIFHLETLSSDKDPDDDISYSTANSTIKRLLGLAAQNLEERDEYQDYRKSHDKLFNSPDSSVRKEVTKFEEETSKVLKKQFGNLNVKIVFDPFQKEDFFKNSSIMVNDDFSDQAIEFCEKGEGTQRAISLSLIQVYAHYIKKHPKDPEKTKPFYLFVDEPELSLHPEAQKMLLESFEEICKTDQVFISTHSPYFLSPRLFEQVYRFSNSKEDGTKVFYDRENKLRDVRENRKFFFHHRDILFKDKVIFLEGAEDLKRYSKYFTLLGKEPLISYLYMLAGEGDFGSEIKSFCKTFNIKLLCIKDLDHLVSTIKAQQGLPQRLGEESQKNWFRRIYNQINFSDPNLIQALKGNLENNSVLVNPYVDVVDFIRDNGSINEEKFEFSTKLLKFLEGDD